MRATRIVVVLAALVGFGVGSDRAVGGDLLKVSVPQRGTWDTGISELGQPGGIFKRHGLTLHGWELRLTGPEG
jgi:hypothetical protein